jgi:hypothetical protein
MFLPVKANFQLPRFPILTVLICLICAGVFLKQQSDWHKFGVAMERYCSGSRSHIEAIIFERIGMAQGTDSCADIMYTITNDPERSEAEVIYDMATSIRPLRGFSSADSVQYVTQMLEDEVRRYNTVVPEDPDTGLAYYTGSWNPLTMITSSFAHGDWMHIVFNLVFFFAFAATVEVLVGSMWFTAFVLVDAWFVGVTGSLAAATTGNHYWMDAGSLVHWRGPHQPDHKRRSRCCQRHGTRHGGYWWLSLRPRFPSRDTQRRQRNSV